MKSPDRVEVVDGTLRGKRLSARTRRAARALAEALFTPEDASPDLERLDWLEAELDDLCARAGRQPRLVLTASLAAIESAPPLVLGRLATFHQLSIAERVMLLERLEQRGLGLALLGAKAMLSIVWYEHPASEREARVRRSRAATRVGEPA